MLQLGRRYSGYGKHLGCRLSLWSDCLL